MYEKINLLKSSFNDYPGRISIVLFFSGCNLICPWCHNSELINNNSQGLSNFNECLSFLKKRRNIIDAVVLTGGEPCLQNMLPEYIKEIKELGFLVKLDTNGMFPAMLDSLINNPSTKPDYIALDLKFSPNRYAQLLPDNKTGDNPAVSLEKSANLIRESGIEHEYRSIALPENFFTEKDIMELAPLTDNSPWYIRPFKGGNCLDPAWNHREEPQPIVQKKVSLLLSKGIELGKNMITTIPVPDL